jgi:hypothetical protein
MERTRTVFQTEAVTELVLGESGKSWHSCGEGERMGGTISYFPQLVLVLSISSLLSSVPL